MIVTEQYNNLPPSFIPKLGPKEVAIYVLVGDAVKNKGGLTLFSAHDTINGPEGPTEIAYVVAAAPKGKLPVLGNIQFLREEKGTITLSGAIPSQRNQFEYMEICNDNGSNPNRDTTKPIWFFRKDAGYKEVSQLERAKLDAEAFKYATETPVDELRRVLAERNVNVKNMIDTGLRAKALEEGKKTPFMASKPVEATDPRAGELRGIIAEAFDAETIKYSVADKCLANTNGEKYIVDGLLQTDPKEKKISKFYQACLNDPKLFDRAYGLKN